MGELKITLLIQPWKAGLPLLPQNSTGASVADSPDNKQACSPHYSVAILITSEPAPNFAKSADGNDSGAFAVCSPQRALNGGWAAAQSCAKWGGQGGAQHCG